MFEAGRPGWILFSEPIGHDPNDHSGVDYSSYSGRGLGVLCRLNHGYEPEGTLPHSSLYESFARRAANFVATSRGCKIWVIGNEMNYAVERPGIYIDWSRHASRRDGPPEMADPMRRGLAVRFNVLPEQSTEIRTTRGAIISPGEIITPEMYARCYRLCRDAIHRLPGHEDDQVIVGAVAPWNTQTIYPGNPNGDWVFYFRHILEQLGPDHCDGFALHAYTHSADPGSIVSTAKLAPPFQAYHVHFRTYVDFLNAVPANMRHLAAYITETGLAQPWPDRNDGWIQRAYAEIHAWNHGQNAATPNQKVRALILYRWPRLDKWYIAGKGGVEEDFHRALHNDYRWTEASAAVDAEPSERTVERERIQTRREARRTSSRSGAAPLTNAESMDRGEQSQPNPLRLTRSRTRSAELYAEWLECQFPAKLVAGDTVTAQVTVRNAGTLTWTRGSGNPVRMGYHYYRGRRRLSLSPEQELRSDLPAEIPPGETAIVPLRVVLPDQPGNTTIEIDLVQEGVAWFKERKSPVFSRWLTVESPAAIQEAANANRNLPVPLFLDVSASLPRNSSPYARRNLNQIRYIVINHTAAHSSLGLERVAAVHIAAGYPGIAYDFVVDASGQVFRVKEMEYAAQPEQPWSEQGVNVCLAGNFQLAPPPLPQIEATGRLCAWLAQNLGLSADAIVGLGDLIPTQSPGVTFYQTPKWKDVIVRQVQLHLAALGAGALDSSRADELEARVAAGEAKNRQLQMQAEAAVAEQERLRLFNERLQGELVVRQRELEAQRAESGVLRLRVHDRSFELKRDASRYRQRPPGSIHYLAIHHTAMAETTPLHDLAEAQRSEWPGLLYNYVIDSNGEIYQTQPLDEAIVNSEPYLAEAIGIAFAGVFEEAAPSNEQIHSGGQLIAWLMERYPQLTTKSILGVSEFTPATTSPGRQWLQGKCWKDRLLAAVRRASGLVDPSDIELELRSRIGELEEKLAQEECKTQSLSEARQRLDMLNTQLQQEIEQRAQPVVIPFVVPRPALRVITDQLPHHPALHYERRSLSQITHIAVHHTAAPPALSAARIAELYIAADPGRGKEAWPGIGYHYLVNEDGLIEQTNALETVSYHVYRHSVYSVGVCFAGSFMNGRIPTSAQMRAGAHLIAWLMQELKAPLARVWGHREFPENVTICPGSEWMQGNRWRDLLFERIEQVQSGVAIKPVQHYLLLWQRPHPGPMARQELIGALGYLVRFRPTVGFRPEEAKSAEYVTILGGEAGVSLATEKMLLEAGCKVERIEGRNDEEIAQRLNELAQTGRRFVHYDVDF